MPANPWAASTTPARLALITDVGPPDCPMMALPLSIWISPARTGSKLTYFPRSLANPAHALQCAVRARTPTCADAHVRSALPRRASAYGLGTRFICAGGTPGYTAPMRKQILYVGDTALREAASYLAGVMQHFRVTFDYVASDQPFPSLERAGYGAVVLSDYPARMFTGGQLEDLAARIDSGLGLLMIGGWESFTGAGGDYGRTVLRDVLPVALEPADDRVNCPQPCLVELRAPHPTVAGLPFDAVCPGIGGYNRLAAKSGAVEVLSARQFRVSRGAEGYEFAPGDQGAAPGGRRTRSGTRHRLRQRRRPPLGGRARRLGGRARVGLRRRRQPYRSRKLVRAPLLSDRQLDGAVVSETPGHSSFGGRNQ